MVSSDDAPTTTCAGPAEIAGSVAPGAADRTRSATASNGPQNGLGSSRASGAISTVLAVTAPLRVVSSAADVPVTLMRLVNGWPCTVASTLSSSGFQSAVYLTSIRRPTILSG